MRSWLCCVLACGLSACATSDSAIVTMTEAETSAHSTDSAEPRVCEEQGGVAMVDSSDYEQSCNAHADCVAVPEGDVCNSCARYCRTGVVNVHAHKGYIDDLETLVHPAELEIGGCFGCLAVKPCCIDGQCHADEACSKLWAAMRE
jgi:hypothetical protein